MPYGSTCEERYEDKGDGQNQGTFAKGVSDHIYFRRDKDVASGTSG